MEQARQQQGGQGQQQNAVVNRIPDIPMVNGELVPKDFAGLFYMARVFANTEMVPKGYVGKPDSIFVAWTYGAELGLSKMASLQNIAVVNGSPSVWGDAVLALVMSKGVLEEFEERFEGDPKTDDFTAVCTAKRKGDKAAITRTFSIGDAKDAGLWVRDKTDADWKVKSSAWWRWWKRMLQMRARSWVMRDKFPDILKGIQVREDLMGEPIELVQEKDGTFGAAVVVDLERAGKVREFDQKTADLFDAHGQVFTRYVEAVAEANDLPVDEMKVQALDNLEGFRAGFEGYRQGEGGGAAQGAETEAREPETAAPDAEDVPQVEAEREEEDAGDSDAGEGHPCSGCPDHKGMMNKRKGVKIPDYSGKCVREGGLCGAMTEGDDLPEEFDQGGTEIEDPDVPEEGAGSEVVDEEAERRKALEELTNLKFAHPKEYLKTIRGANVERASLDALNVYIEEVKGRIGEEGIPG